MSAHRAPKQPRPMHFVDGFSGFTVCGKETSRVRSAHRLGNWDNPILAGGRRCPKCAEWIAATYPGRTTKPESR